MKRITQKEISSFKSCFGNPMNRYSESYLNNVLSQRGKQIKKHLENEGQLVG